MTSMYKAPQVNLLNPNDVVLCKNMYKMPNIMSFKTSQVKQKQVKLNVISIQDVVKNIYNLSRCSLVFLEPSLKNYKNLVTNNLFMNTFQKVTCEFKITN